MFYKVILLFVSLIFFCCHGLSALIYVAGVTVGTYVIGLMLEKQRKKSVVVLGVFLIIGTLLVAKYVNLWFSWGFAVPLGLSYYTLMSVGYLLDVYHGKVKAERNLFSFALFLCFFPQVVAGPIGRSGDLLPQWNRKVSITIDGVRTGFIMFLTGLFEKFVLADNLAKLTNGIFFEETQYEGLALWIGILLYTLRIYFNFAGYSLIAIGGARMLGIQLMVNFKSPLYATSMKEFWRRWHISLSTWFRDYLYIPLGGSRVSSIRTDFNLLLVFVMSGIWHGTTIGFFIWGFLHGIYQIIGRHTGQVRKSFREKWKLSGTVYIMCQRFLVFLLVSFAFIPFQITDTGQMLCVLKNLFVWNPWVLTDETFLSFGLSFSKLVLCTIGIFLVFWIDKYNLKNNFYDSLAKQKFLPRVLFYIILLSGIIFLGVYGNDYNAANFVYGQF